MRRLDFARLIHVPVWLATPLMYLGLAFLLAPLVFSDESARWRWYAIIVWWAVVTAVFVARGWKSAVTERTAERTTIVVVRSPRNALSRRQWALVLGIFLAPELILAPALPASTDLPLSLGSTGFAWLLYAYLRWNPRAREIPDRLDPSVATAAEPPFGSGYDSEVVTASASNAMLSPSGTESPSAMRHEQERPLSLTADDGTGVTRSQRRGITEGRAAEGQRRAPSEIIFPRIPPTPPAVGGGSLAQEVERLGHLRDQGLLSENEFAAAKKSLLGL